MKEEKFKPFDKVVVRLKGTCNVSNSWYADIYSHEIGEFICFVGNVIHHNSRITVLPYNEETAKLIGTLNEWKGDNDELPLS